MASINSQTSDTQATSGHESHENDVAAAGTNGQPQQDANANGGAAPTEPEGGYPPQKHAGAVGFGPQYAEMHSATFSDKVAGLKEEVVGKVKKDPAKVQHGKEMRTGELKRKKLEEGDVQDNPFQSADEPPPGATGGGNNDTQEGGAAASTKRPKTDADAQKGAEDITDDTTDKTPGQEASDAPGTGNTASTVTGQQGSGAHPTDIGAKEQAAVTAPEGTEEAEQQRKGATTHAHADKQIDEAQ